MTDWTPEFPGQRPPFEAGNTAAVTHGARSPRLLAARTEVALSELVAAYPDVVTNDPVLAGSLVDLARLEAVAGLLEDFLAELPIEKATSGALPVLEQYQRSIVRASTIRKALDKARVDRARTQISAHRAGLDALQHTGARLVEAARVTGALSAPETAAQPADDDAQAAEPGGSDDHD